MSLRMLGIRQYYIDCEAEEWKIEVVMDLYETFNIATCVIFCESSERVIMLSDALKKHDFTVSGLSLNQTYFRCEIKNKVFQILQEIRSEISNFNSEIRRSNSQK